MPTSPLPDFWVSKSRLETLIDGVFAIAMTLMVLEIKIPELVDRRSMGELASAMQHNVPAIIAFLLSMGMLGMFWYRHHRQYHFIARISPGLLAWNLAFLTAVAFFPFSAGILGKYPGNLAVYFVYLPNALLLFVLLGAQWRHAWRRGLLSPELSPGAARLVHLENVIGVGTVALVTVAYLGTIVAVHYFQVDRSAVGLAGLLVAPVVVGAKRLRRRLRLSATSAETPG